jgi:hypothetical protein
VLLHIPHVQCSKCYTPCDYTSSRVAFGAKPTAKANTAATAAAAAAAAAAKHKQRSARQSPKAKQPAKLPAVKRLDFARSSTATSAIDSTADSGDIELGTAVTDKLLGANNKNSSSRSDRSAAATADTTAAAEGNAEAHNSTAGSTAGGASPALLGESLDVPRWRVALDSYYRWRTELRCVLVLGSLLLTQSSTRSCSRSAIHNLSLAAARQCSSCLTCFAEHLQ